MQAQNPRETKPEAQNKEPRKTYQKPEIIHALELEIRAGSSVPTLDDLLDPFSSP